jgi:hypothetical protein
MHSRWTIECRYLIRGVKQNFRWSMGKVVKFRMRRRSRLPPDWQALTKRRKASSGMRYAIAGLVLGGIIGVGIIAVPTVSIRPATQVLSPIGTAGAEKIEHSRFATRR